MPGAPQLPGGRAAPERSGGALATPGVGGTSRPWGCAAERLRLVPSPLNERVTGGDSAACCGVWEELCLER